MVIYGRNGTGKSSITDAWEWFHSEKIMHLAREGAGPSSYPHRYAKDGETFIEVQFSDDELGTIRLDFDHSRITIPIAKGDIAKFRALAPHPCHIRFGDLTRFVYLRKAEKYDALAQLMGFTPQVELQKALRRVLRQVSDELETREQNVDQQESALSNLLKLDVVDEPSILDSLNKILSRYEIEPATSIEGLLEASKALTTQVENDPRSQELADLGTLKKAFEGVRLPSDLEEKLQTYIGLAKAFKQEESEAVDLLLLRLYEQGQNVLMRRKERQEDIKCCPLCGQPFEGDLLEHISTELSSLQELKKTRDELEKKRKQVQELLPAPGTLSGTLQKSCQELEPVAKKWSKDLLMVQARGVEQVLSTLRASLSIQAEKLALEMVNSMQVALASLKSEAEQLEATRDNLLGQVKRRIEALQKDTSRTQLVTDHTNMRSALDLWGELETARRRLTRLSEIHRSFEAVVEDYVQSSIGNVQKRFDIISSDVQTYFEMLEADTADLGRPVLKLLTDQDRAVVLQVEFLGEPIYPAYRYLSESQLNSFGLAVFLASAKYFNQDFKFLILDDVINSFDGYKRPQVIRLLKQEFSDHQVLLLTHDRVWRDRLFEACPTWVKRRFNRWEPGVGPIDVEGVVPLEEIEHLIDDDKPVLAGQMMGPFLERQLQELCESFEVLVKYNQRNEYTLDPLLDRFRVRVREKLGKDHSLYEAIEALQQESGFRNLCAHWKNPEIPITSQEMKAVVKGWKAIEELVRCKEECCYGFLRYDGSKGFVCACGTTRLDRV